MSIKPEELEKAISNYLNTYAEDIEDDVVECTDQITKQAKQELVNRSPRGKGKRETPYYKGWTIKLQKKGKGKYTKVIWNKTNYQLTHLLEFGHAKRDGTGWVDPSPAGGHIQPVEEEYKVKFVDLLSNKIRRTK